MIHRKIRMGMVGGGPGSFIGKIHFNAAMLDGQIELVCGAFSSDPGKSMITGREYFLDPSRTYHSWQEMIRSEARLPEGERMDLLCIVTPNHLHAEPALLALENGFHVICDKPLAHSSTEAVHLAEKVRQSGLVFALTHAYASYPMVKEARHVVATGRLGTIRKVVAEYPQGWLSEPLEKADNRQAAWRTDPKRSGPSGCMGDIGTHAFHLAEYITGLQVTELCADLSSFVEGRALDDDGNVLLRFGNGARGVLYASQISAGEENGLKIRVYGEKGGLEWTQTDPNSLWLKWPDRPVELLRTGSGYLSPIALYNTRMPAGHPEGLIEAFANIYRNTATTIRHWIDGSKAPLEALDFPGIEDGVRGMRFIDLLLESSAKKDKWTSF